MTQHPAPQSAALSGSIRIDIDGAEEEFRRQRDEVCLEYAQSEGTRLPGQLTPAEYAIAIITLVAAFIGILLCR